MKNIICAIAKNEEKYILDFCKYHLDLGFDEIHVYDNDPEFPLGQIIDIPGVIVHPWADGRSRYAPQMTAYKDCIEKVDYDWCAFIDVDEFITLDGFDNISDFISSFDPSVQCIHLYERVYGDGGKVEPDNPYVPVYDRILEPSKKYSKIYFKNIVNKNASGDFKNPHIFGRDVVTANSDGNITKEFSIQGTPKDFIEGKAYIRHYKTKTLSEFCEQKLGLSRVFAPTKKKTIDYFFKVNEKTPEKIEYLKNKGIDLE